MAMHVALLRAVNLAGHKPVAMAALCELATRLGLEDARTLLQTGNLVFRSTGRPAELETLLETECGKQLRLQTDIFVRTAPQWKAIVAHNPYPEEAKSDPAHLLVLFLKEAPGKAAVKALQDSIRGRETVWADGRQAYVVYPDGVGRSKLTIALIERRLGTRATGRNWNTVLKLADLLGR